MPVDPRVQDLLEKLMESGRTVEEECVDCPELLTQVQERWEWLRACDARLDAMFPLPESKSLVRTSTFLRAAVHLPTIPGYEIQQVLGRGGMGIIYKARHVRLNREVAVKMLLAGVNATEKYCDRFLREAEAVASLKHPNIVQIYDMGERDGQLYFTMEFVEGGNLAQKLADMPLPPREACCLLATLATAVEAAHQSQIVHRDLKPANILLTADGTPKISDFGLARRLDDDSGLTWIGAAVGTPGYMAPEQAEAKPFKLGPSVDIYALGAILYELLTGRPPFKGETAAETVRQLISQAPVPPSRLNQQISRDLETICLKCLHKEPQRRYVSAAALAADIHCWLAGEAIAARPDGRLRKWTRRIFRRPGYAMAAAIGLLLSLELVSDGRWRSFNRTAISRTAEAERESIEQAVQEELRDVAERLRNSSWTEARVAIERARSKLGDLDSVEARRLLNKSEIELELVARLNAIRLDVAYGALTFEYWKSDEQYRDAFRSAWIGQLDDDPDVVANRILESNIPTMLVATLDHWYGCTKSLRVRNWVAKIARKVDPDPTGWRDRARNPLTLADETALIDVLHVAPVSENCVSLFLSLQLQLKPDSKQRLPFLQRVHHVHPDDYWVNQIIGETLLRENKPYEAIRHFRAAISIQPKTALCHHLLGFTLLTVGHLDEALRHTRMATDIKPDDILSQQLLGYILSELFRYDEAVDRLQVAVSINPNSPNLRSELGRFLEIQGQYTNALAQHQQAISLDPDNLGHQRELRNFLTRRGRQADALASWRANLDRGSVYGANWDGYAEFCLFVGQKEEFSRARQTLLAKFATQLDPLLTEKVALACLLLPGTNEEINQAAALAERSVAVYRIRSPGEYSVAPFAQGLAEYRLGKFDHAIETMQSEASKVLNPGHLLVLAMAQHQIGQKTEARKTLALAGLTHDWRAIRVRNQNDWILHSLRREAEQLILPDMAAFLAGKYQPQDNDERFSLLGVCQFNNRTLALARLYSDAFEVPEVMKSVGSIHRYSAARAAAHAGSGMSEDGKHLSDREQKQWRQQAHHWLKLELADMSQLLDKNVEADRRSTWTTLTRWTADSAIAGLREPGALQKLPAAERDGWSALWLDVERLRNQATHP